MRIVSIALGGCLKAPPIEFGLTGDTGGHLTYVWGAAQALAERPDIDEVEIVTRLIVDPALGSAYAKPSEQVGPALRITRIATGNTAYLSKEAAAADRPAFIAALIRAFERRIVLPDLVHAHFADAAEVAIALRERFGIPFVYTSHSLGIDKRSCGRPEGVTAARLALEDRVIGAADAIVASSRDEAERQLMGYPSADAAKIHRIAPGAVIDSEAPADTARARSLVAPFLRDPDRPMLLAIARPVHKKNLARLVDLYASHPVLRARTNLVIVAGLRDGPESGDAEQNEVIRGLLDRMDAHALYGQFALPRRHDQEDVAALYGLARETRGVFVNPALHEPYGLTLSEAAHHGLPVVATCHGGAADIVRDLRHGLVADPADGAAFRAALHRMIDDRDAWDDASRSGRLRARALNWSSYAERFVELARSIVAPDEQRAPAPRRTGAKALLLCDIDHTLTGCRTGAAELAGGIRKAPERVFGIATGRSLQEARRILSEWGYPDPAVWITSVGSEIYWRRGGRLRADAGYAAHIAEGWNAEAIERALAAEPGLVPQPAVEQRRFKRSWFAAGEDDAMRVRRRLDRAGIPARVIFSHGRLLDVLPARAGKSGAMRWATRRLGLPVGAVFAAGDSGNDRDMLEACPNAILVANYSEELASLVGRPGVHLAKRAHAGGIAEVMARLDAGRVMRVGA